MEKTDGITTTMYAGNVAEYVAEPPNLVPNGGFETPLTAWGSAGYTATVTSPVHSGAQALRIGPLTPTGSTSVVYTAFIVPGDAPSAVLTFWYRPHVADTNGSNQYVTAYITDGTATEYPLLESDPTKNDTWQRVSYNFHRRFNGKPVNIVFWQNGTSSTYWSSMYLDDVQLKVCATDLCNGDFEYGLYGWTTAGSAIAPQSLLEARRTGAYGVRLGNTTPGAGLSGITQTLRITDTQYVNSVTVDFWHRGSASGGGTRRAYVKYGDGTVEEVLTSLCSATTGTWQHCTHTLADLNQQGKFRTQTTAVTFETNNPAGGWATLDVDQVTVTISRQSGATTSYPSVEWSKYYRFNGQILAQRKSTLSGTRLYLCPPLTWAASARWWKPTARWSPPSGTGRSVMRVTTPKPPPQITRSLVSSRAVCGARYGIICR